MAIAEGASPAGKRPLLKVGLAAGDLLCFLVFALLGARDHDERLSPTYFLRSAGPFMLAWLAFAWLLGLAAAGGPEGLARRVLRAWLPAWAAGVVLRALIFARPLLSGFAVIALLVNAALLLAWRYSVALLTRAREQA